MDSVSRSGASDLTASRLSFATVLAAGFAPFSAFILFAAARMPMSYDDAFNATLPLNLLRGNGYASHFGRIIPFDTAVTSGAAFLSPAGLPMAVFGTGMQWPMLYAGALCLALYLWLLNNLHRHTPQAALATAILVPFVVWHGKNDPVVGGDFLPAPPFGYWYQLLGNLPGLLALAVAMSLLLDRAPITAKRFVAIVGLAVFAVNAKAMHLVPLVAMVLTWAALPSEVGTTVPGSAPRLRRLAIALGLLAAGCFGLCLNRVLVWVFLNGEAVESFVANETALLSAKSGTAALASSRLTTLPHLLAKSIARNPGRARDFLGDGLQVAAMLAALIATAVAALQSTRQSSVARLGLVFFVGAAAHFIWWVSLPAAPTRHLTPVPGLVCFAVGCGFGLWWVGVRPTPADAHRRRRIAWSVALALLCAVGTPRLSAALGAWNELREYRNQQLIAAAVLNRLVAEYPDAAFCAPGWWVPRDLTYLAPEGTKYCDLNAVGHDAPGRRILMLSRNLWPLHYEKVRAADERCNIPLERVGRFEFRGCDGFGPQRRGVR